MERLILVEPDKIHEKAAFDYVAEHGESHLNGAGGLDRFLDDYVGWLEKLADDKNRVSVTEYVPATTYFLIRESDGRIVGMTQIRHALNENLLKFGGHIGYGIRPSERRKGYGAELCRLALEKCHEFGLTRLLITYDKENIASAGVIQKNGGLLENEWLDSTSGVVKQRYWVNIDMM